MIVHELFDSEDQAHRCGVIVVCSAYASSAVSLEEVFVAGGFVGHVLFEIGILTEVCGPALSGVGVSGGSGVSAGSEESESGDLGGVAGFGESGFGAAGGASSERGGSDGVAVESSSRGSSEGVAVESSLRGSSDGVAVVMVSGSSSRVAR